jgi:hypothetical protein
MKRIINGAVTLILCVGAIALASIALPLAKYDEPPSARAIGGDVQVASRETDLAVSATAQLTWSVERVISLNQASGTVTRVMVQSGQPLECGSPVIEVDGRPLLAYCAESPLYRAVNAASKGRDADEFAAFVVSLSLLKPNEINDVRRKALVYKAVQKFLGRPTIDSFSPADLVWIGTPTTPTEVSVRVGQIVSADTAVFKVTAQLQAAIVALPEDPAGPVLFSIEGDPNRLRVGDDGVVTDLSALQTALDVAGRKPEEMPSETAGRVRLAAPVSAWAVPASAVVSGSSGVCVFVRGDSEMARSVSVVPVDASVGTVLVTGELQPGDRVLTDPGQLQC